MPFYSSAAEAVASNVVDRGECSWQGEQTRGDICTTPLNLLSLIIRFSCPVCCLKSRKGEICCYFWCAGWGNYDDVACRQTLNNRTNKCKHHLTSNAWVAAGLRLYGTYYYRYVYVMLHFGPHLIVLTSLPKVSYRRHVVEPSTSRLTTPFPHWDIMKCWRHAGTTCHISCRFSTNGRHVVRQHCQLRRLTGRLQCNVAKHMNIPSQ